ncbi:unnamed protein product (macronuclear) [Paramecium tetraurelia]|uniref:Protein kinase domain-containing protein n=1 Tax=Paramecium tetraurelia TaxID=5888 RepID=A0EGA8_PARTE|nr:uncharacterized protein GSPATT00026673001 [Paramecium tetraurelia]CAK94349.1 unnamed protein product [Paramecium tetraurelia]|eukprot:XP_001461722.1 hypothetical protein (macronuclear) [Paramecium tetraurelia strain d4-2]
MNNQIHSFFDKKDHQSFKIWNKFCKTQYKNDSIEYAGQCCRVSKTNKQLKSFSIQIGHETLYAFKNNLPLGMLQLTVVVLLFKKYDDKEILRLKKNGQYVDIYHDKHKQLREILISKCILTTFHNDYKVIKMIGKGTFASVYLAVRNFNGVQHAVKAFSKQYINQQFRGREGLENEIRVMRRLNEKSILHLHEVHETQHSIYFILDLLEGGELFNRFQTTIYSAQRIQKLMHNMLKALFHMHSKQCMHRDLKPENLLLKSKDNDTDIVIADLGLAHIMDQQPLYKRCGTPGFVAPEILKYNDQSPFYNEKCDIFSAGVIFYFMVTGFHPFSGQNYKEILKSNQECKINFDHKSLKKGPYNLRKLLKKMLKADPANRYTADECLKHQYFQQIFNQEDLTDKVVLEQDTEFQTPLQIQKSEDNQEGSMQLMTRQSQWNGETQTVGSLSNCSNKSSANSPNKSDRQQSNPSKFSQFCTYMKQEGLLFNNPNSQKNKQNHDLHKQALRNSYYQKQKSQDDEYAIEDEQINIIKQLSQLNAQKPKMGFIKKSQSLDVD